MMVCTKARRALLLLLLVVLVLGVSGCKAVLRGAVKLERNKLAAEERVEEREQEQLQRELDEQRYQQAIADNDFALCEQVDDSVKRTACTALLRNDSQLCLSQENGYVKDYCIHEMSKAGKGDFSLSQRIEACYYVGVVGPVDCYAVLQRYPQDIPGLDVEAMRTACKRTKSNEGCFHLLGEKIGQSFERDAGIQECKALKGLAYASVERCLDGLATQMKTTDDIRAVCAAHFQSGFCISDALVDIFKTNPTLAHEGCAISPDPTFCETRLKGE